MATDREAALNRAEKCLRQGRLDGAIEEYVRLVDEQPSDWGLGNALGDLYLRIGDTARAFGQMRSVVEREQRTSDAVTRYGRALEGLGGGLEEQAIVELESAARTPSLRFGAAGRLGRLWLERGDVPRAVAWLERAAEAPAPTPDEGFAVLFDLAAALEASGEASRALAVLMELDSAAGGYRDVRAHIDRLSREQAGEEGS